MPHVGEAGGNFGGIAIAFRQRAPYECLHAFTDKVTVVGLRVYRVARCGQHRIHTVRQIRQRVEQSAIQIENDSRDVSGGRHSAVLRRHVGGGNTTIDGEARARYIG
jgi:hypothetical protein